MNDVIQYLRRSVLCNEGVALSDDDLLKCFVHQRDNAAFATLVRRHGPMVLGVCRRFLNNSADADDAFQATFAILVRKARTLSRPEQLSGWLFQVAYRTARRARADKLKRQAHQAPLPDIAVETPIAEIVWRELRPIFDEELTRLPDKLRLPVVLCFLEGQSRRAAARALGWPEGTFCWRLQQARELLRTRLSRRGVTLSATALSTALFEGTASAIVPPVLLSATIQSASFIAAGATLPGPVAFLTQGVIHSMYVTKLKIVAVCFLAVGILGGGTSWVLNDQGSGRVVWAGQGGKEPAGNKAPAKTDKADLDLLQVKLQEDEANSNASKDEAPTPSLSLAESEVRIRVAELRLAQVNLQAKSMEVDRLLAAEGVIPAALINTAKADLQRAQAERNFVKAKLEFAQAALEFARATGDKSSTQPAVRPNAEELSLAELEDRAAWTIRMQKKGYATQAQVDQELDKLAKARRDSSIPHAEEVDFRKREAELQVADVNFKTKAIEVDRLAELAKKGYIPAQTVEKAKSELLRAQAELNLAKVNLEVALAALERSRARRQRNLQKDAVLPQIIAPPKAPELSLPELEEKVELLTKMQKKGYVAQAQVDRARIELAKTTIGNELKKFVELREQLVVQAKQAFAAKSISQQELDQAIADLDDAKKRLKDWK